MNYLEKAMSLVNPEDEVEGNCRYLYLARPGVGKTAAALEWAANELDAGRVVLYLTCDISTSRKSLPLQRKYPLNFLFCNIDETYLCRTKQIPWRDGCEFLWEDVSLVVDDFSMCYHRIEQDSTLTNARENIKSLGSRFMGRMFLTNTLALRSGPDTCCPVDYAGNFEINRIKG